MRHRALMGTSLILAVLLASPAVANSIDVNGTAAIEGQYGLAVQFDGASNVAYVKDETPAAETTYRASFWVDLGTLETTNCGSGCVTQFMTFAALDARTGFTVLRVIVNKMIALGSQGEDQYLFRFSVRNDFGSFLYVGGTILTENVKRKHVTLEWQTGDPNTANGVARLYTSNDGGTPNLQGERTYANGTYQIDQILWGAVAGLGDQASDSLTTGSLHYDSFASYRSLLP